MKFAIHQTLVYWTTAVIGPEHYVQQGSATRVWKGNKSFEILYIARLAYTSTQLRPPSPALKPTWLLNSSLSAWYSFTENIFDVSMILVFAPVWAALNALWHFVWLAVHVTSRLLRFAVLAAIGSHVCHLLPFWKPIRLCFSMVCFSKQSGWYFIFGTARQSLKRSSHIAIDTFRALTSLCSSSPS